MKTPFKALIFCLCVINYAVADEFPAEAWRTLRSGSVWMRELPVSKNELGRRFEAVALMKASVSEWEHVLLDYARYPEFMPHVATTRIEKLDAKRDALEYTLALPMGYTKRYRLAMSPSATKDGFELAWRKLDWPGLAATDTVRDTQGAWRVTLDAHAPDQVLIRYQVYTDPGAVPFGTGWIVDLLSERSVPDVVEKTRDRIKQLRAPVPSR
ncbi:MAG: hypothetical protein OEW08_02520 [Gammaproteobacteria bacterium]|nr:hypothetical protein [Gammaproteobacteria bacterium]